MSPVVLELEKKVNEIVAHQPVVRSWIEQVTEARGAVAKARLAKHKHSGATRVRTYMADVDGYIVLERKDGQGASIGGLLSVEFGRVGGTPMERVYRDSSGVLQVETVYSKPSEGVHALGAALGVA